jgi:Tol biopolymer transport system component
MIGGTIEKIRDDAASAIVSWDDKRIAFTNGRSTEIWVRDAAGSRERRIFSAKPGGSITSVAWSPDNQHLAFVQRERPAGQNRIDVIDVDSRKMTHVLTNVGMTTACWTADGSIIFNLTEPPPNENSENLWELPVSSSGQPSGGRRRLTDLFGFQFAMLRASATGKHVSYIRSRQQSDVMTAQILASGQITAPRRLTEDDRIDWPGSWTQDSRSVLFFSDRNGAFDIFQQTPESNSATLLLASPSEKREPQLSPDGRWLMYLTWDSPRAVQAIPTEGMLMRVPVEGGLPERIMSVNGYPGSARVVPDDRGSLMATGHPHFRCPRDPAAPCIVSEIVGPQMVLTAFDPLKGRLAVVDRIDVDPANMSFWDLSADGSQLVVGQKQEKVAALEILYLDGWTVRRRQHLTIRDWNLLEDVAWSADAKSLFLVAFRSDGNPLLHADLNGRTKVLHKGFVLARPVASPDGKFIAFGEVTADSNVRKVSADAGLLAISRVDFVLAHRRPSQDMRRCPGHEERVHYTASLDPGTELHQVALPQREVTYDEIWEAVANGTMPAVWLGCGVGSAVLLAVRKSVEEKLRRMVRR